MANISTRRWMATPPRATGETAVFQPGAAARTKPKIPGALLTAVIGTAIVCATMTVMATWDTAEARKGSSARASGGFYGGRGAGRAHAPRHVGGRQAVRYPIRNVRSFRSAQKADERRFARARRNYRAEKRQFRAAKQAEGQIARRGLARVNRAYRAAARLPAGTAYQRALRRYNAASKAYVRQGEAAAKRYRRELGDVRAARRRYTRVRAQYLRYNPPKAELRAFAPAPRSSYRKGPRPLQAK
jgi:hypothetical protein